MLPVRVSLRVMIYALLVTTFFLGLPHMHYATAIAIAVLIRHKNEPKGIFGAVNSTEIKLPSFDRQASFKSQVPRLPVAMRDPQDKPVISTELKKHN